MITWMFSDTLMLLSPKWDWIILLSDSDNAMLANKKKC